MAEDDSDDIARAAQGDHEAFARLVRKHQRRVYATAYHIMGNHGDSDDVAQDAFIRAYKGLPSFDGRSDLFTWLYRITVNTALNHLRSKRRAAAVTRTDGEALEHAQTREDSAPTPAEWASLAQSVRDTLLAVCDLSPTLRVTLVLATVESLPYRRIAEILEIPEGTVAWRVNEARKQLRLRIAHSQMDETDDEAGEAGDDTGEDRSSG